MVYAMSIDVLPTVHMSAHARLSQPFVCAKRGKTYQRRRPPRRTLLHDNGLALRSNAAGRRRRGHGAEKHCLRAPGFNATQSSIAGARATAQSSRFHLRASASPNGRSARETRRTPPQYEHAQPGAHATVPTPRAPRPVELTIVLHGDAAIGTRTGGASTRPAKGVDAHKGANVKVVKGRCVKGHRPCTASLTSLLYE